MAESFKVEILGSEYTLKGDVDPGFLEKVAFFLKEKIEEVRAAMPTANKVHVVMLTALNISCDYLQTKEALERMEKAMEAKSQEWISKLDALNQ